MRYQSVGSTSKMLVILLFILLILCKVSVMHIINYQNNKKFHPTNISGADNRR
jgi:hypothetical protein